MLNWQLSPVIVVLHQVPKNYFSIERLSSAKAKQMDFQYNSLKDIWMGNKEWSWCIRFKYCNAIIHEMILSLLKYVNVTFWITITYSKLFTSFSTTSKSMKEKYLILRFFCQIFQCKEYSKEKWRKKLAIIQLIRICL